MDEWLNWVETRCPEEQIALVAIGAATGPIGSRKVTEAIRRTGMSLSESTVSRLLRRLDGLGLTQPLEKKGRVLTTEGRRQVELTRSNAIRSQEFARAVDIRNLGELLDLLVARRSVEREAARAAAVRASEEDLQRLRKLWEVHRARVVTRQVPRQDALDFHRLIGRASGNRIIAAMTAVVLDPQLDHVEALLDVIVGSHHSEVESVAEHSRILEAIMARDEVGAEIEMAGHLDRLIQETQEYTTSDLAVVIERMLAQARAESTLSTLREASHS